MQLAFGCLFREVIPMDLGQDPVLQLATNEEFLNGSQHVLMRATRQVVWLRRGVHAITPLLLAS